MMKERLGNLLKKIFKKELCFFRLDQEKKDLWAKNLFSDLGRLRGKLIVMRMG